MNIKEYFLLVILSIIFFLPENTLAKEDQSKESSKNTPVEKSKTSKNSNSYRDRYIEFYKGKDFSKKYKERYKAENYKNEYRLRRHEEGNTIHNASVKLNKISQESTSRGGAGVGRIKTNFRSGRNYRNRYWNNKPRDFRKEIYNEKEEENPVSQDLLKPSEAQNQNIEQKENTDYQPYSLIKPPSFFNPNRNRISNSSRPAYPLGIGKKGGPMNQTGMKYSSALYGTSVNKSQWKDKPVTSDEIKRQEEGSIQKPSIQTPGVILYKQGLEEFRQRNYKKAHKTFSRLITLSPRSSNVQFAYGLSLFFKGDYKKSANALRISLSMWKKEDTKSSFSLKKYSVNQDDFRYHYKKLHRFTEKNPNDANASSLLYLLSTIESAS